MGNINGREDGENGSEDNSVRSENDFSQHSHRSARIASLDLMTNSPPESPGILRTPLMFTPQIPVTPLKTNYSFSNQVWDSHLREDLPHEKGIPTMITWNHGGNSVFVEGSWDNWKSRKPLQRTGKDYSILLVLASGVYHCKFIVDGEWKCAPDLPLIEDDMGRLHNILDVNDYIPEHPETISEFENPPSPDSSYSQPFLVNEDFTKEPQTVPPQLSLDSVEKAETPKHVILNHLFIEKGCASQSIVALGLTHRFQSKYVTVLLYKSLKSKIMSDFHSHLYFQQSTRKLSLDFVLLCPLLLTRRDGENRNNYAIKVRKVL